jgi:hypothetical protein
VATKSYGSRNGHVKSTKNGITQKKAAKILKDGAVHGKALTRAQQYYFGVVAGGKKGAG